MFQCIELTKLNKSFIHKLHYVSQNIHEFHSNPLSRSFLPLFLKINLFLGSIWYGLINTQYETLYLDTESRHKPEYRHSVFLFQIYTNLFHVAWYNPTMNPIFIFYQFPATVRILYI